jgi:hypothetical protein
MTLARGMRALLEYLKYFRSSSMRALLEYLKYFRSSSLNASAPGCAAIDSREPTLGRGPGSGPPSRQDRDGAVMLRLNLEESGGETHAPLRVE